MLHQDSWQKLNACPVDKLAVTDGVYSASPSRFYCCQCAHARRVVASYTNPCTDGTNLTRWHQFGRVSSEHGACDDKHVLSYAEHLVPRVLLSNLCPGAAVVLGAGVRRWLSREALDHAQTVGISPAGAMWPQL